jgi:predicted nucleotidyltransferase
VVNGVQVLGRHLAPRVQAYLDELIRTCVHIEQPLVSLILFGSAASGGFSDVSDVDLLIVVPSETKPESKQALRTEVARLEVVHGFRSATPARVLQARIERAVGHQFSCFICTRDDLMSGDVARILDLRPWEAPFVDRIVLASIAASAATASGENLLPGVRVPPVRRLDVFKALFGFACQIVLIVESFPLLPDATKYAMGVLKHSLHSCFFCYHRRTAPVEEEVEFFSRRLGASRTLDELLSLRRQYRRSFGFVIRCLPTITRIHLRTARENRFAS